MKLDIGQIISIATVVPQIVKGVQGAFGHESGPVRKQHAMDAANEALALVEGVAGKDLANDDAAQALLSEAIELGVTIMKAQERLRAIASALKPVPKSE